MKEFSYPRGRKKSDRRAGRMISSGRTEPSVTSCWGRVGRGPGRLVKQALQRLPVVSSQPVAITKPIRT